MISSLHSRIDRDFTYHPPKDQAQVDKHVQIRERAKDYAHWLVDNIPEGRELSRALSALEDVTFNANAALAREP